MKRWVEHYGELSSTENTTTDEAFDAIESLPVMTELDTQPTEHDLSKDIDSLTNGKAPGKDTIQPKIIKHGQSVLLHQLHVLLLLWLKEGTIPRDMRDANIVGITLYKNKGDHYLVYSSPLCYHYAFKSSTEGVYLHTRADGNCLTLPDAEPKQK